MLMTLPRRGRKEPRVQARLTLRRVWMKGATRKGQTDRQVSKLPIMTRTKPTRNLKTFPAVLDFSSELGMSFNRFGCQSFHSWTRIWSAIPISRVELAFQDLGSTSR